MEVGAEVGDGLLEALPSGRLRGFFFVLSSCHRRTSPPMRHLDTLLDHPDTASSLNVLEKYRCLKHDCPHLHPLDYVQWDIRTCEAPALPLALNI